MTRNPHNSTPRTMRDCTFCDWAGPARPSGYQVVRLGAGCGGCGHCGLEARMSAAAHAASLASQRQAQQLNAYWDRLYWIRETTRLYWGVPR